MHDIPEADIFHAEAKTAIAHSIQVWWQERRYTRLVFVFPEYNTSLQASRQEIKALLETIAPTVQVWSLESVKWLASPNRPIVLVGSLYQVVSGLLNRSFAVDRSFQPMMAGLLANDSHIICLHSSLYGWCTFSQKMARISNSWRVSLVTIDLSKRS